MSVKIPSFKEVSNEYDDPMRMCYDLMADMTEQFNAELDEKDETIEQQTETIWELKARVRDDENDIGEMKQRINELESQPSFDFDGVELKSLTMEGMPLGRIIDPSVGEMNEARNDIRELEETVSALEENSQSQTNIAETDTELEFLASLNPGMLDDESANKRRAVEIVAGLKKTVAAKNAMNGDYYRVTSKQLREGLDRLDEDSHSQTVKRTRDFIEDLAEGQAKVEKKYGQLNIYIEQDLVKSVQSHRGDGGVGSPPPETTSGTS